MFLFFFFLFFSCLCTYLCSSGHFRCGAEPLLHLRVGNWHKTGLCPSLCLSVSVEQIILSNRRRSHKEPWLQILKSFHANSQVWSPKTCQIRSARCVSVSVGLWKEDLSWAVSSRCGGENVQCLKVECVERRKKGLGPWPSAGILFTSFDFIES